MGAPAELELDDDPAFQLRFWKVQRMAWGFFALILVFALAGGAGAGGVLADRRAALGAEAEIVYPAVARWRTSSSLRLRSEGARPLQVEFDRAFLDLYAFDQVTPAPERSELVGDGVRMSFAAQKGGWIYIDISPRRPTLAQRVGVSVGGHTFRYSAVVLP